MRAVSELAAADRILTSLHSTWHLADQPRYPFHIPDTSFSSHPPSSTLHILTTMRRGPNVSLSLKQRLGQLATAASAPNSPIAPPSASPRRSYFPTWGPKRGAPTDVMDGLPHDEDRLHEVVSKMIFQAGVDFECVRVPLYIPFDLRSPCAGQNPCASQAPCHQSS